MIAAPHLQATFKRFDDGFRNCTSYKTGTRCRHNLEEKCLGEKEVVVQLPAQYWLVHRIYQASKLSIV